MDAIKPFVAVYIAEDWDTALWIDGDNGDYCICRPIEGAELIKVVDLPNTTPFWIKNCKDFDMPEVLSPA